MLINIIVSLAKNRLIHYSAQPCRKQIFNINICITTSLFVLPRWWRCYVLHFLPTSTVYLINFYFISLLVSIGHTGAENASELYCERSHVFATKFRFPAPHAVPQRGIALESSQCGPCFSSAKLQVYWYCSLLMILYCKGYGSRVITDQCPEALAMLMFQATCGVVIQALMTGNSLYLKILIFYVI